MSAREWKPGDVGVTIPMFENEHEARFIVCRRGDDKLAFCYADGDTVNRPPRDGGRPLVVIDPEDREQVERLILALPDAADWGFASVDNYDNPDDIQVVEGIVEPFQVALREFANPEPKPEEPTDPTAIVTDRRDNIWRLLADGDWVCTSGPDIGEYLNWGGLTERGPLEVELP